MAANDTQTHAARARTARRANGGDPQAPSRTAGFSPVEVGSRVGAGGLASSPSRRIPKADLDERDPDYIRETLPGLWMLASYYFRADVRGLDRIPAEGPVLLVGNHSGGNLTPDTHVFTLAFSTYFGVERRFFQLAHNLVLAMPGLGFAAQVRHRRRVAGERRARRSTPAPRCSSTRAATTRSTGRRWDSAQGRLRRPQGLHPARAATRTCRSSRSSRSAARRPRSSSRAASGSRSLLGLDRLLRLKVLPISLALPWGLNIGDMLGHFPLPAKITIQALDADRPARGVRLGPGRRRGLRRTSSAACRPRSRRLPRSAGCR